MRRALTLLLTALLSQRAAGGPAAFASSPDALAPLLAARFAAPRAARSGVARSGVDAFVTLTNGIVELGIDMSRGGSVGAFGPAGGPSYVNVHDMGREVQVSYYTGPAPYDPPGCDQPASYAGFPYNPIGAGDFFGNAARILSVVVAPDNTSAVVTSVPAQWACNNTPAEGTLVKTITLVGSAAEVSAQLTLARPDRTAYGGFAQELPAVYVTGAACALWAYTGDAPYTGAPATQLVPGDPAHGLTYRVSEQWLAFMLPDGSAGVGVWHPASTAIAAMRWNASAPACTGGPTDDATGYVSPRFVEVLDADIAYAYNYSLVWGGVPAVRAYAAGKAARGLATPGPRWSFAGDRQHFTPLHCSSAWPIVGAARLDMPADDPSWVSGYAWWRASDAPTLWVTAAYGVAQHDTQAQLFFLRADMPPDGYDGDHVVSFDVVADGAFHTYAVPLARAANYSGVLVGLRYDPVVAGAPGAYVDVACISSDAPGPGGRTGGDGCRSGAVLAAAPTVVQPSPRVATVAQPPLPRAAKVFDVRAYGAVGDGTTSDTAAVRRAAAALAAAGGGDTLLFPSGFTFLTGCFNLTAPNTTLSVEGTILGSRSAEGGEFVLVEPLRWYGGGVDAQQSGAREWQALVRSYDASGLTVSGGGAIDGQGDAWWVCAQKNLALPPCSGFSRPNLLLLEGGSRLTVHSVTLRNSPSWTLHVANVSDVHIYNTTILAPATSHNTDAIDVDCSSEVLIEDCKIAVGDDAVAVKSGIDWLGRTFGRRSENILVRRVTVGPAPDKPGGDVNTAMTVGSEMSAGVRNVTFEDITMIGTALGSFVKSERGRGGTIEDVTYRNVTLIDVTRAFVVTSNYAQGLPPANASATPHMRGVTYEGIRAHNAAIVYWLDGLPEAPLENLTFADVDAAGAKTLSGKCDHVTGGACRNALPACPPCF